MTNLDSILKSRDITLPTKFRLVKAMVFPGFMYGCESWTIKKESWALKNWCFWTVVLEKILESPLDCKEIKPDNPRRTDAEADAPILWPPDTKNWLIGNDPVARRLKAEGKGDDRRWDGWMASPTRWTWVWANSGSWWWTGKPGVLQSMGSKRVRHDWMNWTELWALEHGLSSCGAWA